MHTKCSLLVFMVFLVTCESSASETQCIDYYKSGSSFDLSAFHDQWYAVYFWPPNGRRRESCEVISFKNLSRDEVEAMRRSCASANLSADDNVLRASYVNSVGKLTNVTYYGKEEVKSLYRSCDRISKYIFLRVNNKYVLGINCSAGGRGMLLTQNPATASEVQSVVNSIEIMTGREGSLDCPMKT